MNIVVISDTHEDHEALGTLSGDVLIHCGDFSRGRYSTGQGFDRLDAWFERQRFRLILCTGGNHDFGLQEASLRGINPFRHAVYLEDRAYIFEGIKFYGAPWVPELKDWAFYQEDSALKKSWERIPGDTDVLVTHTPPYGVLDRNSSGRLCGCFELRDRISELSLKLHCFGHIHASAGILQMDGTTFINGSMVDRRYRIARPPVEFSLKQSR